MTELSDYPNTGQIRVYDIEAISLPIVYNKFGDHDPNGLMYVLKQDSERVQRKARELFALLYLFSDMADTRSGEDGTNIHGLFGAVIVEAAGSAWFDPVTGEPLDSGLFADIYHPMKPAFREYAVFFHDELEIDTKDGQPPVDPHTGLPSGTTAISYRSEPMRNRLPLDHHDDHTDIDEDISMSSWAYGDPAPPIPRAYVGDPAKIRLIHGGVKETHVFHLHNHQWRLEPDDPKSTIIDSISISPQECYTLDILYGAGSLNGMIGDAIFHCHLYPHFHEGMWTLFRVFDRLQDGSGLYPNGTPIEALMPLRDRPLPPEKDEWHPGYPNFINGQFGEAPLQPPPAVPGWRSGWRPAWSATRHW